MNKLTEGNSQSQALESPSVEVKFLTLALYFYLLFLCFYDYIYVLNALICLFSLGLPRVDVRSMISC